MAELGVAPGPALRELEARILDHVPELTDLPQAATIQSPAGRLIGRDADLQAVADALTRSAVVTLVGPGGIGKTRLALAAAGDWLVELAGITSPADVPGVAADALDVGQQPGQTLTRSIVAALRSRQGLLVVDNCEHVLAGAADLVQAVVAGCPQVRVLATSRERLAVGDEQVIAVGPLNPLASAELFHARALAADRSYDAGEHHEAVVEVCRRLDGILLAIELAAARTISHRPADLVARLHDRLGATGGRRTGTARHRTLRAAMQWSYDLLNADEQALLRHLAAFPGSFDVSAAEAVHTAGDIDDLLSNLVGRSMVTVDFAASGRRFRLLETTREFAARHLRATGRADVVADRHARWCLAEVTAVHRLLTGREEIEGAARLGELWPHLRAAVAWACTTGDAALADALVRPVVTELPLRGRQEIGAWAERILAVVTDPELRAFWLLWVAERFTQNADPAGYRAVAARYGPPELPLHRYADAYATGDGETLRRWLPDAAADLHRVGSPDLAEYLDVASAGTLLSIGRFDEVDTAVTALADRCRETGPPTLLHQALQTLGYSASFQGRRDAADLHFDEAAHIALPPGTLSANKTAAARSAFRRGERRQAFELLRSHVDELIESDNVIAASVVSIEFITMTAAIGRTAEAAHMLGYLAAAGDFGALAVRTLAADAAAMVAADARPTTGHDLDDRAALIYMRASLTGLVADDS